MRSARSGTLRRWAKEMSARSSRCGIIACTQPRCCSRIPTSFTAPEVTWFVSELGGGVGVGLRDDRFVDQLLTPDVRRNIRRRFARFPIDPWADGPTTCQIPEQFLTYLGNRFFDYPDHLCNRFVDSLRLRSCVLCSELQIDENSLARPSQGRPAPRESGNPHAFAVVFL